MTVDYTIAAIPTMFRGILYRSRLEARWAAFFYRLKWQVEYEPIDFGPWSPDFLVTTQGNQRIFVEIKPISQHSASIAAKMTKVIPVRQDGYRAIYFMLCGLAPKLDEQNYTFSLGTFCKNDDMSPGAWQDASLVWIVSNCWPEIEPVAASVIACKEFAINNEGSRYSEYARLQWSQACNDVQWKGPGK